MQNQIFDNRLYITTTPEFALNGYYALQELDKDTDDNDKKAAPSQLPVETRYNAKYPILHELEQCIEKKVHEH